MIRRLSGRLLIFLSLATIAWADEVVDVNSPFFQKLEKQFLCVDGCGMALENCTNATAKQMRGDLIEMIDEGANESEIQSYMVSIYGYEVLREPPRQGFNLIVWVLPFAAVVFGGVFVFMVVNRWVFSRKVNREDTVAVSELPDDEVLGELIDQERRKLL